MTLPELDDKENENGDEDYHQDDQDDDSDANESHQDDERDNSDNDCLQDGQYWSYLLWQNIFSIWETTFLQEINESWK